MVPRNAPEIASRCAGEANAALLASGDVPARESCSSACKMGTCCFPGLVQSFLEPDEKILDHCFVGNEEACLDYLPCLALAGLELDVPAGGVGEGDASYYYPPAPDEDLKGLCSESSTANIPGYVGCRTACLPGRCVSP